MNERIEEIIVSNNLKKTEFARRINVSQAYVSQLCTGTKTPSDRTIADICREFGVREEWLRHGTGEMLVQRSLDQEIAAFLGDATSDKVDFKYRLISVLARMKPEQWELLEQIACDLADEMKKADP